MNIRNKTTTYHKLSALVRQKRNDAVMSPYAKHFPAREPAHVTLAGCLHDVYDEANNAMVAVELIEPAEEMAYHLYHVIRSAEAALVAAERELGHQKLWEIKQEVKQDG